MVFERGEQHDAHRQRGAWPVGFKGSKAYWRRAISGSECHEHGHADVELKEMGLGHAECFEVARSFKNLLIPLSFEDRFGDL